MFAKINEIDLLMLLFNEKAVMTPGIRDEIVAPLAYGYTFPLAGIGTIRTVPLTEKALENYVRFQINTRLGRGELEGIAYCKAEKSFFAANDTRARRFAENQGVSVISFQTILRSLWKRELKTREEVWEILQEIMKNDGLMVTREVEKQIFSE
jgi:predicted nucleic acid-binding protein